VLLSSPAAFAKTVLVLGDSLSAGYGIQLEEGWVHLLRPALKQHSEEPEHKIVNASVSGETSAGGLARLPALLKAHSPDIVILELGGNDGLRGHSIKRLRSNLEQIVALSKAADAQTLLVGIQIPPNYGRRYTNQFRQVYQTLAEKESLALVPFLLEQVALKAEWMQADGIHPKAVAQSQIMHNVLPYLVPLLDS
jgi:acyl-CoA thioesterase-1